MNENSSRLEKLCSNKLPPWQDRRPEEKEADKAALGRLVQNPDLEPLLRYLEYRKALAQRPVDLTNPKWQEIALARGAEYDLIVAIASQLQ